ncbi:hypothetical protein WA171_005890, partial [Blastocystis sp. BT1]
MIVQLYIHGALRQLDISNCETGKDIKVAISKTFLIPVADQKLSFSEQEIKDDDLISEKNITNNDILLLESISENQATPYYRMLLQTPVSQIPDLYRDNPPFKQFIDSKLPPLQDLLRENDTEGLLRFLCYSVVTSYIKRWNQTQEKKVLERGSADEMDPEYQKKVYEAIRNENLNLTRVQVLDARPIHLYLVTYINDVQVNFVVDTGAQSTILSSDVAEATKVARVVDESESIDIYGVGSGRTMGMVNAHDICIEGEYFAVKSQVVPKKNIANSCLLGLDFLKQYKAVIDIESDTLTVEINNKKIKAKLIESAWIDPLAKYNEDGTFEKEEQPMDVEEESGEEIPLDPSEQQILDTANQLQAMGYSAEDSMNASAQANGNIELAITLLEGNW